MKRRVVDVEHESLTARYARALRACGHSRNYVEACLASAARAPTPELRYFVEQAEARREQVKEDQRKSVV